MAGYPPGAGMPWGVMHGAHPAAVQQLPQRPPQALPIEALGLTVGSRLEVRAGRVWLCVRVDAGACVTDGCGLQLGGVLMRNDQWT
jgi:hypothetical protein